MKKDRIFSSSSSGSNDFQFTTEVAEVFDDMVTRSIPFYAEQQRMIQEIAKSLTMENEQIMK